MPQMMPLSWLALFIVFSLTFTLFNIISYFSVSYPTMNNNKKSMMSIKPMGWKW
nr:ATP synthase F0 subunit 8 [Anaplecta sp. 4 ZQW-2020]